MVCVAVGVGDNSVKADHDNRFHKEHKGIMGVNQEKHTVQMKLKQCTNVEKIKGILQESLPAFLDMLKMEGFTNGCELCGESKENETAYVAGTPLCLCSECYDRVSQNAEAYAANEKNKKENLVGGIVGALLGSLLGGKLTKRGIVIAAIIMIIMTYVGDRLDWAITIARELEVDIFYGYRLCGRIYEFNKNCFFRY